MKTTTIRSAILATAMTIAVLMIPLITMSFNEDIDWSVLDFAVMGVLIFTSLFLYLIISKISLSRAYKAATGVAAGTGFFLIWANLAVGIIGSEDNPVNIWFFLVPFAALIGAATARFKPQGMALSVLVAGITQIGIATAAWLTGYGFSLLVNSFFALLWLISARLFLTAAHDSDPDNDDYPWAKKHHKIMHNVFRVSIVLISLIIAVSCIHFAQLDDAPGLALIGIAVGVLGVGVGWRK